MLSLFFVQSPNPIKMKKYFFLLVFFFSLAAMAQDTISSTKAKEYLNKMTVVTGKVVSFKLASEDKTINYINIDKAYPDQNFTVVLTNAHLAKLNLDLAGLKGKTIFVTGKISTYKNDPKQIPQIFNPIRIDVKND